MIGFHSPFQGNLSLLIPMIGLLSTNAKRMRNSDWIRV
jgi:hypothetical protein